MRSPIRLLIAAVLLLTGCVSHHREAGGQSTEGDVGAHVQRGKEKEMAQNDLRSIAQFYATFIAEMGRPPKSADEFVAYLGRPAANLAAGIKDGRYVIVPNAGTGSNAVVAYEKEVDLNGNQLVARADATVKLMKPEELKAALQNPGG